MVLSRRGAARARGRSPVRDRAARRSQAGDRRLPPLHGGVAPRAPRRPGVRAFALIGAGFSFLSALVGSVGPLMAPFFLAYGLVKGAYIGTEALATVVMHLAKLAAYQGTAILTLRAAAVGLALGPTIILGSYVGKRVLDRLPERVFVAIIELVLIGTGVWFLIAV